MIVFFKENKYLSTIYLTLLSKLLLVITVSNSYNGFISYSYKLKYLSQNQMDLIKELFDTFVAFLALSHQEQSQSSEGNVAVKTTSLSFV